MYPSQHFILGIIFSSIVLLLFPQIGFLGFLLILASTLLIDVDHYLYYVFKKKDLSLRNAHRWFFKMKNKFFSLSKEQQKKVYGGIYFLHGIEILIIIIFLSTLSKYFWYVFLGFSFHLILDIIYCLNHYGRLDKISLIRDIRDSKKLIFLEDI